MSGKSLIISSIILSLSIIFCTYRITERMYTPNFPSNLSVTTYDGNSKSVPSSTSANDFITMSEAAAHLGMDETKLMLLVTNRKLVGTYTSYTDDKGSVNYIFSSSKLAQRVNQYIENGNKLD